MEDKIFSGEWLAGLQQKGLKMKMILGVKTELRRIDKKKLSWILLCAPGRGNTESAFVFFATFNQYLCMVTIVWNGIWKMSETKHIFYMVI